MLKSGIKGFGGETIYDTYGIFEKAFGKEDKKDLDRLIYDLYYEVGYLPLNMLKNITLSHKEWEEIKSDDLKQLDLTLKYLYPLLRDGKLEVEIGEYKEKQDPDNKDNTYFHFFGGKKYKKEEVEKAIKDIRNKWISISNKKERECFEDGVEFTLGKGLKPYSKEIKFILSN